MMINRCRSQKGQSLVETALVLPILLLVLTGIIDFGLLFNNYLVISNASREGARNAAVGASDSEVEQIVTDVSSTLEQDSLTIVIEPSGDYRRKGNQITVTVTYQHEIITPLVAAIIPNPLSISSKSVMRME